MGLRELAENASRLLEAMQQLTRTSIRASSYEKARPTIWYARKYVRACMLRMYVVGTACLRELKNGDFASAALLSRSVIETSAMLVLFSQNLTKAARTTDRCRIQNVVRSHYLGSKAFELTGSTSPHVMDALRAVKEQEEWVQAVYDMLSEVAHPNWAGTTQVFIDDVTIWEAEPHINQGFASALGTNVLLGLYTMRLAQSCAEKIEGLLNELSVSEKTRGI